MTQPQDKAKLAERTIGGTSFSGVLIYSPKDMAYRFRGFKCPMRKIVEGFNWGRHIEKSFHDCMKPMTDKFMKVV